MRAFLGWHRMCDRVLDAQEIGGVDVVRASVEVHLQP